MAGTEDTTSPRRQSEDQRPVPDPTILTTAAIEKGQKVTIDLLRAEITGIRAEVASLRETLRTNRQRGLDDHKSITQLMNEKFRGVKQQFRLVEDQRKEQKLDTKQAVDAALAAAKEAVKEQTTASDTAINKSEASITKQLDQLAKNFDTGIGGVTTIVNDLKGRLTVVETARLNAKDAQTERRQDQTEHTQQQQWSTGLVVAVALGVLGGLMALGIELIRLSTGHG